MLRRHLLLAAGLAGAGVRAQEPAAGLLHGEAALAEGEAALARGDALGAMLAFMRAAERAHKLPIELGIVRSHMLMGRYRQALAFAAHTAGAHLDSSHGAVMYAWLLAAGGQGALAQRVLAQAEAQHAGDTLLTDTQRALGSGFATRALLQPPVRVAPYSVGALPESASVVAAGMALPGGMALAPASVVLPARRIWTRDSRGRVAPASVQRELPGLGLALLQTEGAAPRELPLAERDPFPGAPAMAVGHAVGGSDEPAWPGMRHGFLGRVDASGERGAGLAFPPGPRASPVFDVAGRWIGVAADGDRLLVPSALRAQLGAAIADAEPATSSSRQPSDAVYELGLSVALQVLVVH